MSGPFSFALVGQNIEYSQSPAIFKAIFDYLKAEGEFSICSIGPEDFDNSIKSLIANGISGFSVTIPYKQKVIDLLDSIDPVAKAVLAVNSVVVQYGKLSGFNTDCYGFSLPLEQYHHRLVGSSALIIGNGGAARAVIIALYRDFGVKKFTVAGRSPTNVNKMVSVLEGSMDSTVFCAATFTGDLKSLAAHKSIVVNCTPLGGANHADKTALLADIAAMPGGIYYDLNYNRDNKTIRAAHEAGAIAINGSAMLVGQAIKSFEIWTGQTVPFQPIFDAVFSSAPT